MSTNFTARIQQQMHGSAFDYFNRQLGIDLVTAIPTADLSSLKGCEGDYPQPWSEPKDLPADIVKAVLPSGRPLVAVRYHHQEKGKETLILEIFLQRYSKQVTNQIKSYGFSAYVIPVTPMESSQSKIVSNWVEPCIDSIYNAQDISAPFRMIRNLANGEPLDKTDGRYLPMYADLYEKKYIIEIQ